MTKPKKWLCAQRTLRSAWASTQSDQSLRCALNGLLRTQAFFMRTAKTLIRLGRCPVWSESSLGAKVILLVLSWGGSNYVKSAKSNISKKLGNTNTILWNNAFTLIWNLKTMITASLQRDKQETRQGQLETLSFIPLLLLIQGMLPMQHNRLVYKQFIHIL